MSTGRPRKPTALHKVQGTARPDRINEAEPKPRVVCPEAPEHMSEGGKLLWAEYAPKLNEWGVLTEWDLPAFEIMCEAYATAREAGEELRDQGLTMVTPKSGVRRKNPNVEIREKAWARFCLVAERFGMTPAGRGKISGRQPDEDKGHADRLLKRAG